MRRLALEGTRFGHLLVLQFAWIGRWHKAKWLCQCDCGVKTVVYGTSLRTGRTRSCGCAQRFAASVANLVHGETAKGKPTKEYRTWLGMRRRCLNANDKNYRDYGGRGIGICKRWLNSFENFLADVGRAPDPEYTIDRINNDGNYELGNVRWATREQQAKNKRRGGKK